MRRRADPNPEPCSIGCDTIVNYLEQMGRPNMAEFARRFERMAEQHARERTAWMHREQELCEMLSQYQRRESHEPHNPRPPAEASD